MEIEPIDPFSDATGLSGPFRARLEGPGLDEGSTIEFRGPYLVVGRDRPADLVIPHPDVSRRHAYFQVVAGEVFCIDLGSRTGVRWDGEVRAAGWVDRERGVEIGSTRIRFELAGDDAASTELGRSLPISRSFQWGSLPEVDLEFLGADSDREPWSVSRAMVLIGRSAVCRIRFPGPGISRIHAALVRTPAGVWVVDLLGPSGVRVEDTSARSRRLEDGDRIAVGDHQFRVRLGRGAGQPSGPTGLARNPSGRGVQATRAPASTPPGLVDDETGLASRLDLEKAADPLTARLLDEFDRMHRRTTDQFQKAILMMFRMHQDQMDVIRNELTRLDRLEEEQKALQEEMTRGPTPPPPRLALRLVSGEPSTPPPVRPGPAEAEVGRIRPTRISPAVDPVVERPDRGKTGPSTPEGRDQVGPDNPPGPDQHALLARRIAEIKEERQGLWQKLLSTLTGVESEGGPR